MTVVANIKSAIKRDLISKQRRIKNASEKSALKTAIRRCEKAIANSDKEEAENALKFAVKKLDKAARKGLIHKNKAARKKSKLTRHVTSLTG